MTPVQVFSIVGEEVGMKSETFSPITLSIAKNVWVKLERPFSLYCFPNECIENACPYLDLALKFYWIPKLHICSSYYEGHVSIAFLIRLKIAKPYHFKNEAQVVIPYKVHKLSCAIFAGLTLHYRKMPHMSFSTHCWLLATFFLQFTALYESWVKNQYLFEAIYELIKFFLS